MTHGKNKVLLLVVFAAGMGFRLPSSRPQESPAGAISGTVTREGANDPIPDVEITVVSIPPQPATPRGRGVQLITTVASVQEARDALSAGAPFVRDSGGRMLFLIGSDVHSVSNPPTTQEAQYYLDLASRNGTPPLALLQALRLAAGRDGSTGAPLPASEAFTTVTDQEGHFTIENVPAGRVVIRAQRQGYMAKASDGVNPPVASQDATIVDKKTAPVRLTLVPGGAIHGRVVDANGRDLSDVPVQAFRVTYREDGTPALQQMSEKTTDDRGEYRLFRLPPGLYYVAAGATRPASVARGAAVRDTRMRTLYPSALELSAATPISIRGGEEASGVDIRVQNAPTVRVSGTVISGLPADPVVRPQTSSFGEAGTVRAAIAEVVLVSRGTPFEDRPASATITAGADGAFQIAGVLPGSYDLIARLPVAYGWNQYNPPGKSIAAFAYGRIPIEVRDADLSNLSVVVRQGQDLKGIVTIDGRPAAAAIRISLQPDDVAAREGMLTGTFSQIGAFEPAIQPDGSFTIPVVPEARYRIRIVTGAPLQQTQSPGGSRGTAPQEGLTILPATTYVADIRQGSVSVYDEGLNVTTAPATPLEIMLGTNPGIVAVTVTGADQQPVAGATVVLVPSANRRQNPALYQVGRSGADGQLELKNVPPGSYKVFAWESVQSGAYRNVDFLERFEPRGAAVTVSTGIRVAAEAVVIREAGPGN